MLAYRRRKALPDWLSGHGSLTVHHAASRLTVSEVTIRSDFRALERQGMIRGVHGGAVLAYGDPAQGRDERRPDAHPSFLLAQRATAMVEDGESVAALEETGHVGHAMALSQGADWLALEELQRPGTPLIGAVVFSPDTYGERVIALALDILAGKKVPAAKYQGHWLIRAGESLGGGRAVSTGSQREDSWA